MKDFKCIEKHETKLLCDYCGKKITKMEALEIFERKIMKGFNLKKKDKIKIK